MVSGHLPLLLFRENEMYVWNEDVVCEGDDARPITCWIGVDVIFTQTDVFWAQCGFSYILLESRLSSHKFVAHLSVDGHVHCGYCWYLAVEFSAYAKKRCS